MVLGALLLEQCPVARGWFFFTCFLGLRRVPQKLDFVQGAKAPQCLLQERDDADDEFAWGRRKPITHFFGSEGAVASLQSPLPSVNEPLEATLKVVSLKRCLRRSLRVFSDGVVDDANLTKSSIM